MSITLRLPNRKKQKFLIGALYKYYHKFYPFRRILKMSAVFLPFSGLCMKCFLGEDFGGTDEGFINNRAQKAAARSLWSRRFFFTHFFLP